MFNVFPMIPDGFIFKDCINSLFCEIPFVKSRKTVFFLDVDKNVKRSDDEKVFLPFVHNEVLVPGISVENIEQKYEEYRSKMDRLRFECLNKLATEGIRNTISSSTDSVQGKGIFFYFLFQAQSAENNSMLFTEKFSAVWSTEKLISGLDSFVTIH